MKLLFKKNDDKLTNVFQKIDDEEKEFSYVEMIKALILSKNMEDPEILDGFTDEEIKSIKSMVTFINKQLSTAEEATSTNSE